LLRFAAPPQRVGDSDTMTLRNFKELGMKAELAIRFEQLE